MSISPVSTGASALTALKSAAGSAKPSGDSNASASADKTVASTTTVSNGDGTVTTTIAYSDGSTDVETTTDLSLQPKQQSGADVAKNSALGNLLDPGNVAQRKSLLSSQEDPAT